MCLLELPIRDLLLAQRASRRFNGVINTSPRSREKLFFFIFVTSRLAFCQAFKAKLDPLLMLEQVMQAISLFLRPQREAISMFLPGRIHQTVLSFYAGDHGLGLFRVFFGRAFWEVWGESMRRGLFGKGVLGTDFFDITAEMFGQLADLAVSSGPRDGLGHCERREDDGFREAMVWWIL